MADAPDLTPYPRNQPARWDVIPPGAELREANLSPRWIDLLWWDVSRRLWVYIATRPNPNPIPYDA